MTVIPLIAYLIGFAYSLQTGVELSTEQAGLLQSLLYGFLGSGAIGAYRASRSK